MFNSETFTFIVLPLLIFMARICDVTIGTLRIIFVSKGKKVLAPILGFFEVLIWIIAISKIMQNLDNVVCYIAYAAGFATGNYVGMFVEEKLAIGLMMVRVVTSKNPSALVDALAASDYGVTSVDAWGSKEKVSIVYTVVKRNNVDNVISIIEKQNPHAFYSIEDIRYVNEGIFPAQKPFLTKSLINFKRWRPGK